MPDDQQAVLKEALEITAKAGVDGLLTAATRFVLISKRALDSDDNQLWVLCSLACAALTIRAIQLEDEISLDKSKSSVDPLADPTYE